MTVEMDRPFVWPEVPDLEKWDKKVFDAEQKDRGERQDARRHDASLRPTKERKSIAEQAQALLDGEDSWQTGNKNSEWENVGEEMEVETDVQLPKIER
jgi:large subunit ribosomal protein L23